MNYKEFLRRGAALLVCRTLALPALAACSPESGSSSPASQNAGSSAQEGTSSVKEGPEEGQVKNITLKVVHGDGSEKEFPVSTTADTLGDALEAEGLISGEESSYGLFITTVDGETADDSKQEWWNLTQGGVSCTTGVGATEIADGDSFELVLTVGY